MSRDWKLDRHSDASRFNGGHQNRGPILPMEDRREGMSLGAIVAIVLIGFGLGYMALAMLGAA